MATLYELSDAYTAIQNTDELNGEDLTKALESINELFQDKAGNIGKLILSLQSDAEGYEKEIARLSLRKMAIDNRVKSLKAYLAQEMTVCQVDKVKNPVLTISLRNSPPSVNILDEGKLPPSWWRVIPEQRVPDKIAILNIYKDTGEVVPGTEIITDKKFVVIR